MKRLSLYSTIIAFLLMLSSCSPAEQKIRLYMITTGNGFTGFYIKNGKEMTSFTCNIDTNDVLGATGGVYLLDLSVSDVESIRIYVTGMIDTTYTTTTKEVLIYVDDELVKQGTNTGVETLTLTYTWGEENSSDSTTDTSS